MSCHRLDSLGHMRSGLKILVHAEFPATYRIDIDSPPQVFSHLNGIGDKEDQPLAANDRIDNGILDADYIDTRHLVGHRATGNAPVSEFAPDLFLFQPCQFYRRMFMNLEFGNKTAAHL